MYFGTILSPVCPTVFLSWKLKTALKHTLLLSLGQGSGKRPTFSRKMEGSRLVTASKKWEETESGALSEQQIAVSRGLVQVPKVSASSYLGHLWHGNHGCPEHAKTLNYFVSTVILLFPVAVFSRGTDGTVTTAVGGRPAETGEQPGTGQAGPA